MIRTFFYAAVTAMALSAQTAPTIDGEIVDPGGHPMSGLTVALCINSICGEQVAVNSGRFRFQTTTAHGNYTIQVLSQAGEMLHTQPIYVDSNQAPVRVILPDSAVTTVGKDPSATVSIGRLRHHPPKAASKELERALESFRHNQPREGTEHLEKALAADPEFPDAHYLLGLTLEANGSNDQALKHLEEAAPAFPKAHVFAANILSRAGNRAGAQSHLRKYLQSGDPAYRDKVLQVLRPANQDKDR